MFDQALRKCLGVFFITFAAYSSGTVASILGNQKEYLVGRQPVFQSYAQNILQAHKSPILKPIRAGLDLKSGFDLNDEEKQKFNIWEKGEIPFYIDIPSFSDKSVRDKIRWFLNEVNTYTTLNFIELPRPPIDYDKERWVYFLNRQSYLGCHDVSMANFTLKGVQRVVVGYDCLSAPGGLPEIVLAIVGIPPQHNAPNRDEYIEVVEENIMPEKKYLYQKLGDRDWLFHDLCYDYESAGHFHQHKHSINGSATIILKEGDDISVNGGFSEIDILKINLLYTYIVKKSNIYMPECQKLFAEVEDLDKLPQSIADLEPVPKPNKYLGINDDRDKLHEKNSNDKDKGDAENSCDENEDEAENVDSNKDKKENDENEGKRKTRLENENHLKDNQDSKSSEIKNNADKLFLNTSGHNDPVSHLYDSYTYGESLPI